VAAMASIQSVRDEATWRLSKLAPLAEKFCADREVSASQSRKWLTERLRYLPQVRRFFGEELPQLSKANANF
jgi:hypothetical protein